MLFVPLNLSVGYIWLVYYEVAKDADTALLRERQMKKWHRGWKLRLI